MKREEMIVQLLPDFAEVCRRHLDICESKGIHLLLTSGYRTWQDQLEAYRKGRAQTAGGWVVTDPHKVVTFALPEHDAHCRGAAYDVVPIVNEKAAWDRLDLFQTVGEIGEKLGLVWGGRWPKLKDMPHFEMAGWRMLPLKENVA